MNSHSAERVHTLTEAYTHTYMFGHRQSMAKYTETLPLAHPPKTGSPICTQTMRQSLNGTQE